MAACGYAKPNAASNAIDYAKLAAAHMMAVTRVYDDAGNVIQTHEQRESIVVNVRL